uniref:Uncharacterized protein n=1 Tax=Arundo donax TaxID=35708 RepID=A0A0A9BZC4_ARUDO
MKHLSNQAKIKTKYHPVGHDERLGDEEAVARAEEWTAAAGAGRSC